MSELEASLIQAGWEVYSNDGQRVGSVLTVESEYLEMELEVLGGSVLAVPLSAVQSADTGRVELDVPSEEIGQMGWTEPPAVG
jgi:hypothetical protein